MVELIIHGTKQGFQSNFVAGITPSFTLSDIRNGNNSETPIGGSFYSLAFIKKGCVFSKYTIIRDTLRSHATGNIAFSLLIPFGKELSGKGNQVKQLLDTVADAYFSQYVRNNNINRNTTEIIYEDWSFLDTIRSKYSLVNKSESDDHFISGRKDPAYHYYKTEEALIQFLDNPHQEEYREFEQILFIDSTLKGNTNPLYVIRNSGIEVNPDLVNPKFTFNYFKSEEGLTIRINDVLCDLGDVSIRANDNINIYFEKKYHGPLIDVTGALSDSDGSEIHKYFKKSGKTISLNFDNLKLKPEVKSIQFRLVKDCNSNESIDGAEIKLNSEKNWDKNLSRQFVGSQIGEQFKITARMGTDWESEDNISIKPETISGDFTIELYPVRRIEVKVLDFINKNHRIKDFTVLVDGHKKELIDNKITFMARELTASHNIQVIKDKFENSKIVTIQLNNFPTSLEFELNAVKTAQYKVVLGTHGKFRGNRKDVLTQMSDGANVIPHVQTNWRWKLDRFEPNPDNNEIHARYKRSTSFILTIISLPLFIAIGLFVFYTTLSDRVEVPVTQLQIEQYTSGIDLNKDTLDAYRISWDAQRSNFIKQSNWWDIFSADGTSDYELREEIWNSVMDRITGSLQLRENLNNLYFHGLKDIEGFDQMRKIQNLLSTLDSNTISILTDSLVPYRDSITREDLNLIFQRLDFIVGKIKRSSKNTERAEQNEAASFDDKQSNKSRDNTESGSGIHKSSGEYADIITYIQGKELDKTKLRKYRNDVKKNDVLKTSIGICIDFWSLDTRDAKALQNYKTKVENNQYLRKSKLLDALKHSEMSKTDREYNKRDILKKL